MVAVINGKSARTGGYGTPISIWGITRHKSVPIKHQTRRFQSLSLAESNKYVQVGFHVGNLEFWGAPILCCAGYAEGFLQVNLASFLVQSQD